MRVGFIGIGNMGLGMARNILKAHIPLAIYNRTEKKVAPLIEHGAHHAKTIVDLAAHSDVVITMVSNDEALIEVVEGKGGLFSAKNRPSIHISMSTISPDLGARMEESHLEKDMVFLAAPVSGRPERAHAGHLWIFLSGREGAKKKVIPILETMSLKIYDLGESARQALLFKLCNNFMILSLLEAFSEANALLEKNGISTDKSTEIWGSSVFDSPVFHAYTPMLCSRNFNHGGGFALNLGLKDMRLLEKCADQDQVPMPFLNELHNKLLACINSGKGHFDWSAITLIEREMSGLKP